MLLSSGLADAELSLFECDIQCLTMAALSFAENGETLRPGHIYLGPADVHAEIVFAMAIVLYDKYFPEEHRGALAALCGLAQLLDGGQREDELKKMLDATYPLVLRAARALRQIVEGEHDGNGGGDCKKVALKVLRTYRPQY